MQWTRGGRICGDFLNPLKKIHGIQVSIPVRDFQHCSLKTFYLISIIGTQSNTFFELLLTAKTHLTWINCTGLSILFVKIRAHFCQKRGLHQTLRRSTS